MVDLISLSLSFFLSLSLRDSLFSSSSTSSRSSPLFFTSSAEIDLEKEEEKEEKKRKEEIQEERGREKEMGFIYRKKKIKKVIYLVNVDTIGFWNVLTKTNAFLWEMVLRGSAGDVSHSDVSVTFPHILTRPRGVKNKSIYVECRPSVLRCVDAFIWFGWFATWY